MIQSARLTLRVGARHWLTGSAFRYDGALEVEHESKSCLHSGQGLRWHFSRTFFEVVPVYSYELRDVRHGVSRKADCLGREKHVAGGVEKARVRRDHDPNDCANATPVEGVRLDDHDRKPKTWLRPARLGQVSPPDFSPSDYHSEGPMLLA